MNSPCLRGLRPAGVLAFAILASTLAPSLPAADRINPLPDWLTELETVGTPLDLRPWRCRKVVKVAEPGVQQLELDLDVLARAAEDFRDLRLVRDGRQIPYLLERAAVSRHLVPNVEETDDPKRPSLSRWKLMLPRPRLPLTTLSCACAAPYFQRAVRLWETRPDRHGREFEATLGSGEWTRMPGDQARLLTLSLAGPPVADALFLEIDNGDNPPLELEGFAFSHPVARLLFASPAGEDLQLYYGNPDAAAPRYELRLVEPRLRAAEKLTAGLGAEEILKAGPVPDWLSGRSNWVVGTVLALVAAALIAILVRLLPKTGTNESRAATGPDSAKEDR